MNGTAILAQSAVDLIAAVDYYLDALDYIVSEDNPPGTDPQEDELVYVDPNDRSFLDSINQKLIILRDSLAGDTVGVYPLETTKTYQVYDLSYIRIGELVLVYDPFGMEGEGGNLSFADSNSVPSPWEVEWFAVVDSNQIEIELDQFSGGQWLGGYFQGVISPDCNTITGGTFEYWGYGSGALSELSAQHVRTDVLDGYLDLNPLFGGSGRYPSPVNPRDVLTEFDRKNEPISGTFGHGLGDDPTLGGIFPDMTQELWAILFDLPVSGLRFEEGFRFRVGEHPVSATIGDLNGDGLIDIVTANADSDDVSVLLGAGNSSFLAEQRYVAGEHPASIALGDLNGDKILDIVVANEGSNDVSVLMGLGGGEFQNQRRYTTGLQPSGVAVGDVTGDGIADIVTSNRGSSDVCVLAGLGDGDMRTPVLIAVGGGPAGVALGDLNLDGKLDIVTADDWSCTMSVLLALGDGQFEERRSLQAGGGPSSVVVGDLNGDGVSDIVTGNIWSDDVTVALGNGDGTFQEPTSFDTAEGQFSVALGDVNGDGVTDIVTANTWADEISVLLGVGDGTFGRRSRFDAGGEPQYVLVGDLDADGIAEILTANGWSNDVSVFMNSCTAYGHYPSGSVAGPVGAVRFRFPPRMDTGSFTLEQDLGSFVGPDGPIEANGFLWINAQTLEIRFAPQYKYGSYRMAIGPHILNGYGRTMNVDGDSLYGELIDDRYVATFMVFGHGDLVITSVEAQGHPTAGRKIAVSWDGLNADMENTIGQGFIDAVYLSVNDEWDIDDIHVATIPHAEPLGPQEGYHRQTDVVLPGLQPGEYYIVVRTDPGNQIDEPNGENNNIAASDPIIVDVNRLTVGEELTDGFMADERERYYSVEVSGGEDLEIRLNDLDDMGTNELYVSFGQVPSRSSYDYCYPTKFSPDQTLTVPDTRAGTYYAMAYAAGMGGSGYSEFTIGARYLPMEIRAVDPNKGGNMSSLPLGVQIKGARFRSGATALLRRAGHTEIPATEVKVIDTSTIFAKFDLLGAVVGSWTMVVTNPDLDAAIFPFELFEGGNAKFEARLILPEALAFNRRAVLWIEYANSGDGPMPATLLKLHGSQNALLTADKSLDGEGLWTDSPPPGLTDTVQVLALGSGQDCGILNPGDSGRFPIYYRGLKLPWDWSRPPIEFRLGVLTTDSRVPIDWSEVEAQIRPCCGDPNTWEVVFARLRARIGGTWGRYVQSLMEDARRLAAAGRKTYSVRELFGIQMAQAHEEPTGIIAGRVVHGQTRAPVGGAKVMAWLNDETICAEDTTLADGSFCLRRLPAGQYGITVENHLVEDSPSVDLLGDKTDLELRVVQGGTVVGIVTGPKGQPIEAADLELDGASATLLRAKTDAKGGYVFRGIAPGEWKLAVYAEGYASPETTLLTVDADQTRIADLSFLTGASVTGRVTSSSGAPLTNAIVLASGSTGFDQLVAVDAEGYYTISALAVGTWHLTARAPGYASSSIETAELADGDVIIGVDFVLANAVPFEGAVLTHDGAAGVPHALVVFRQGDESVGATLATETGTFEYNRLSAGTYTAFVSATSYREAQVPFELTSGGLVSPLTVLLIPTPEGAQVGLSHQVLAYGEGQLKPVLLAYELVLRDVAVGFLVAGWENACHLLLHYVGPLGPDDNRGVVGARHFGPSSSLSAEAKAITNCQYSFARAKQDVEPRVRLLLQESLCNRSGAGAYGPCQPLVFYFPGTEWGVGDPGWSFGRMETGDFRLIDATVTSNNGSYAVSGTLIYKFTDVYRFTKHHEAIGGFDRMAYELGVAGWATQFPTSLSISDRFACTVECEEPPDPNTDPIDGGDANSVGSFDPNKKLGPRGFGSGRYVRPGASMIYTVQFENEPNATGAAKKVRIVDQLDEDLDWTSFELLEIGFGPHNLAVPKGVSHHRTKTMVDGWTYRKGQGWNQNGVPMIVEVEAELDIETGQAVWEITAYDPETGWEPQDAYAGFLPPDDLDDATHRGEGFVRFFVRAKENLPVGTQIRNSASIVFDVNPAIETPDTVNTILIDRGDLDLSGDIDLRDVALLVDRWLWVGPPGAIDQDIAPDGVVDFLDFAAMVKK